MMNTIPFLHDLSTFLPPALQEISSTVREVWEIPFENCSAVWSVVLAYLNSFSHSRKSDLKKGIGLLLGVKKVDKRYMECVEAYNPFFRRNSCFRDEVITEIVQTFLNRIVAFYNTHRTSFPSTHKNCIIIDAASLLLKCNIVVISPPITERNIVGFVKLSSTLLSTNKTLVVFMKLKESLTNQDLLEEHFTFCIRKTLGREKQIQALGEILKGTKLAENDLENLKRTCSFPDIINNFLITLIKSDLSDKIPFIYKSPYILAKLKEAAIVTDPRKENESGESAFYHLLLKEDTELLYFFYDYVANNCLLTDSSVRLPDPVIVKNLSYVKDNLTELRNKICCLADSEETKTKALMKLKELTRFNDFQSEVCQDIINVQQHEMCSVTEIFEVSKRKDVILYTLKNYLKFFDRVDGETSISENEFQDFREFHNHQSYFDNLDFCSAVIFFDNFFLLKERLVLPENAYLGIESQYFLFIYCKKYFELLVKQYSEVQKNPSAIVVSNMLIFQERISLKTNIFEFEKILKGINICEDNITPKLPENSVLTLINLPELYGEFLIFRLHYYLDAAINIKKINAKSILIIERAFQVVGECLKDSTFRSIQKILPLCLPNELVSNLKQIRNEFSHPTNVVYRLTAERDLKMFKRISSELRILKSILEPVFLTHKYYIDLFILYMTFKAASRAAEKEVPYQQQKQLKTLLFPNDSDESSQIIADFQANWSKNFTDIHSSLKDQIISANRSCNVFCELKQKHYIQLTRMLTSSVKKELHMELSSNDSLPERQKTLDDYFWRLEFLLKHICTDINFDLTQQITILKGIYKRQLFFKELTSKKQEESEHGQLGATIIPVDLAPSADQIYLSSKAEDIAKLYNSIPLNKVEHNLEAGKHSEIINSVTKQTTDMSVTENENFNQISNGTPFSEPENELDVPGRDLDIDDFDFELLFNPVQTNYSPKETTTQGMCSDIVIFEQTSKTSTAINEVSAVEHSVCEPHNELEKEESSLELLFDLISQSMLENEVSTKAPTKATNLAVLNKSSTTTIEKWKQIKEKSEGVLDEYENITENVFNKLTMKDDNIKFSFPYIQKFRNMIKGKAYIDDKERKAVLKSIPEPFNQVHIIKEKITGLLENKKVLTKDLEGEFTLLPLLKTEEKREILDDWRIKEFASALGLIKKIKDPVSSIKEAIQKNTLEEKKFDNLSQTLELPESSQKILLKIVLGHKQNDTQAPLEFLRYRIKLLKEILIEGDADILKLWKTAISPRKRLYVHERVLQSYLSDPEVRVSVEMLLHDCMVILKTRDLQNLCRKASNLFSGINLRNVLAHGNPLLESLGRLLDPFDLPSELVRKALQLIGDLDTIDCIQKLLDESGTMMGGFLAIMNDELDSTYKSLRERILDCKNWKDYAFLISAEIKNA